MSLKWVYFPGHFHYFECFLSSFFLGCISSEISWVLQLRAESFNDIKNFVKTVQDKINFAKNNTDLKAAVTTFGYKPQRIIKCEDHKTVESFNEAVEKIQVPRDNGGTNIRDGLESGLHSLMNDGCGENNIRKIIILVVDSVTINGIGGVEGLIETSKAIQEAGVIIIAITIVQPRFSTYQLNEIVSSPKYIHLTASLEDPNFKDYFVASICGAKIN